MKIKAAFLVLAIVTNPVVAQDIAQNAPKLFSAATNEEAINARSSAAYSRLIDSGTAEDLGVVKLNRVAHLRKGSSININIIPGTDLITFDVVTRPIGDDEKNSEGYAYYGRVISPQSGVEGFAQLYVGDKDFLGYVVHPEIGRIWLHLFGDADEILIERVSVAASAVVSEGVVQEGEAHLLEFEDRYEEPGVAKASDATYTVRILWVVTQWAREVFWDKYNLGYGAAVGSLTSHLTAFGFAYAGQPSWPSATVTNAGTMTPTTQDFVEGVSPTWDVNNWMNHNMSYFEYEVRPMRDYYNADVVAVVGDYDSDETGSCGAAVEHVQNPDNAFMAIDVNCVFLYDTHVHEFGHIFGGVHDQDPTHEPYGYPWDYVSPDPSDPQTPEVHACKDALGNSVRCEYQGSVMNRWKRNMYRWPMYSNPEISICIEDDGSWINGCDVSVNMGNALENTARLVRERVPTVASFGESLGKTRHPDTKVNDALHASVYPDPSFGHATFEYHLTENSRVSLIIYDTIGVKRASVFEGLQGAGSHRIDLSTSALAAGKYFCVIDINGTRSIHPFMLIR